MKHWQHLSNIMTTHCFDLGLPPLIKKVRFKLSGFFLKDIAVFVGLAIYLFFNIFFAISRWTGDQNEMYMKRSLDV